MMIRECDINVVCLSTCFNLFLWLVILVCVYPHQTMKLDIFTATSSPIQESLRFSSVRIYRLAFYVLYSRCGSHRLYIVLARLQL